MAATTIDLKNAPDFSWLSEAVIERLSQGSTSPNRVADGTATVLGGWIHEWVQCWAQWGFRYVSLVYDRALEKSKARRATKTAASPANKVTALVPNLRIFLLDYLTQLTVVHTSHQSRNADEPRWLLPEELLDPAFHGSLSNFRDDFWNKCCADAKASDAQVPYRVPSTRSLDVQSFLDFIAHKLNKERGNVLEFRTPFLPRSIAGSLMIPAGSPKAVRATAKVAGSAYGEMGVITYVRPVARDADKSCSWISRDYPHLSAWEPFAREYVGEVKKGVSAAIRGISLFMDRYLANAGVVGTPGEGLDAECAKRPIPDEICADALLLLCNKDRVPKTLAELSSQQSKRNLRSIRDGFIPHILRNHCSLVEGDHVALLGEYWNPFANIELDDSPGLTGSETSRNAMPYRWIRRLRSILAQGPHFCDWEWAQQAQLTEFGNSADWFRVDESVIDRYDPDCVFRERTTGSLSNGNLQTFYEIWSPVRWVALLVKLNTAMRTVQVRILDSGESDDLRFDLKQWAKSTYPNSVPESSSSGDGVPNTEPQGQLAPNSPWIANELAKRAPELYSSILPENLQIAKARRDGARGWKNGVLCPEWTSHDQSGQRQLTTLLYVNSNKTADAKKEGAAKGFKIPLPIHRCPIEPDEKYWLRRGDGNAPEKRHFSTTRQRQDWLDELGENTHWWLAKLRDWQAKYNPVTRRVRWKELDGSGLIEAKSDEQLEMYLPACFLFREPSMNKTKKHPGPEYPVPNHVIVGAWWALLKELQVQLNKDRPAGRSEIRLLKDDTGVTKACEYDLHSIRVSIITALIVDGKVPVEFVQRLVGHSRVVMTIYYTKINPLTMMREIHQGFSRATELEVEKEKEIIQNSTIAELRATSAFNDVESAITALGMDRPSGRRNVVMWMRKLGGICPVGGVTHDTEGGLRAGCFNGGSLIIGKPGDKGTKYAPVEGGPGTCVNCRWFITRMPFIGELQAIAENSLYRYHDFKSKSALQSSKIERIKDEVERLEVSQGRLTDAQDVQFNRDLDAAETIRDSYLESATLDLMTAANAYGLLTRLKPSGQSDSGSDGQGALIANGLAEDVRVILEETDSAMLHAARICLHSEIHPEINAPAATLRAAQVIARKLQDEQLDPFALLSLPEEVQTQAVNAVTRHIALLCDSQNTSLGLAKAAALLESEHRISAITGVSPIQLGEWVSGLVAGHASMPTGPFKTAGLGLLEQVHQAVLAPPAAV